MTFFLRLAGASGTVASLLPLSVVFADRRAAAILFWLAAAAFYLSLLVFARPIVASPARRWLFAVATVVAFLLPWLTLSVILWPWMQASTAVLLALTVKG